MDLPKVFSLLNQVDLISFATVDGDKPRVRLMALIPYKQDYYCVTIAGREKIRQLEQNNSFEFTTRVKLDEQRYGQIRARGVAFLQNSLMIKEEISSVISWFEQYWSSFDDPNFILFKLKLEKIITQEPGAIFNEFMLM
ncbi:MAG: hypothetical protein INQ03_23805 [Candidatus Heimdallarchaeota archaeon]|nr:hypothetical protein [Candidatus Heimdallarchaeota archaeon]